MQHKMSLLAVTMIFLFLNIQINAQENDTLSAGIPEKEGVSSEGILNFLNAAENSNTEFHSFIMLRHGKIVAEGWWNPYAPDLKHTMYSCSKSFTATAIGFAVSEKLLSVNDKVITFFRNEIPDTVSSLLSGLTIKDVLSMSDGQEPDPTFPVVSRDSNWVRSFLAVPIVHQPGSKFLYNSLGTYMLSAIIQKVTGQKLIDYLTPRLFVPLGIREMDWEVDPLGINVGGWGLRIKTEDMAKFGQLFLQKGKWNGKQILPESWVTDASTVKIVQHPAYSQAQRDSSDWEQGYCYQMWRCRNNAFRADGAYGQYIIVMPDQDAVIAITAETPDMQEEINLVWKYLLPAIHQGELPVNKSATDRLSNKLAMLSLPLPAKANSKLPGNMAGKVYLFEPNNRKLESMSFKFGIDRCDVTLKVDTVIHQLAFGEGNWHKSATTKRGPSLVAGARASFVGLPPFKIAAAYTWKDERNLVLTLRYIESPHTETITCHFDGNDIAVEIESSLEYGTKKSVLKGRSE
ncbi:MAG: serine hydrolase [Ferruginibacter sp.]